MEEIINVRDYAGGLVEASRYIHSIWGRPDNFEFYRDCIEHSSLDTNSIPRFYLMLDQDRIIGCYALITNDLISRQDLWPWLACLWVEPDYRGRELGKHLLAHGISEAKRIGYKRVYLTTDHDGYYERYGWQRIEDGYDLRGDKGRIYTYSL